MTLAQMLEEHRDRYQNDLVYRASILEQRRVQYAELTLEQRTCRTRRMKLALYSLTEESYSRILNAQGNSCAACGQEFGDTVETSPCIDHDRKCCSGSKSCGKCVRGLLCRQCNRLLGVIERNEHLFKYLRRPFQW